MTAILCNNNDEWGEWEMGDFGFYEDLDDDDDNNDVVGIDSTTFALMTSSSSNLFSGPPTPSSDITTSCSCSLIDDPQPATLTSYPPILSSTTIDQLLNEQHALPWSLQENNWVRLFSSSRDGTSFGHFMRSVRNVANTIVVAKTSSGMVVGGFSMDVWSGRKQVGGDGGGEQNHNASFLFLVEPPPPPVEDNNVEVSSSQQQQQQQIRVKRFIPGLEDLASSPTGVLEFNFDALSLSSSDKSTTNNKEEEEVHIFKPSSPTRQAPLKQVCQLGNKFISLGEDDADDSTNDTGMKNLLTIENSFSKGEVIMTLNDGRCIMEEFDVVNFEVYCLSDDD